MTGAPRVVACLSAWNAAAFIRPVLDSLAAQTYPNLEVLISVDVCEDGTADICETFAAAHPNARVIRQPARLGWVGNSNALLRAVTDEPGIDYLFFAFHDDPLRPDYAAKLVAALERNPAAVLAFSDVDSNIGPFSYRELDGVSDRFERARQILLQRGPWWVPNRGLLRASTVATLGGMRRHWAGEFSADWPWLLRLALAGEFVRVPEVLLSKNFRPAGLSSTWRKGMWNRIAVQLECLRVVQAAGFPPAQALRLLGERCLLGLKEERWRLQVRRRAGACDPYALR